MNARETDNQIDSRHNTWPRSRHIIVCMFFIVASTPSKRLPPLPHTVGIHKKGFHDEDRMA